MKKSFILYLVLIGAVVILMGCSREVDAGRANIGKADAGRANIGKADAVEANIGEVDAGGANVRETDAVEANIGGADAGGADAVEADIRETDVPETKLTKEVRGNGKTEQNGKSEEQVREQIGWEDGQKAELGEIQTLLEEAGIAYTGYYNDTEERIDMELEDGTRLIFLMLSDELGEHRRYELILDGDGNLNSCGFQEGYHHEYGVTIDEEFYSGLDKWLLTEESLWRMNLTDLSIARNQFYAVRGRIFRDPFLNAVFRTKSWYEPLYEPEEFEEKAAAFNETEKENLQAIRKYEEMWKNPVRTEGGEQQKEKKLLSGSWLDLDGDGKREQILYETVRETGSSEERYFLTVNGVKRSNVVENPYPHLEVVELDHTTTLLLAGCNGPSDDPRGDYYLYEDQNLLSLGEIGGALQGVSDGVLYILAQYDFFQSNRLVFQYRISRDKKSLDEQFQEFYEYGNQATAIKTIPLYQDQKYQETGITLNPGDVVTILGSDLQSGVQIQKKDGGETGWLRCRPSTVCILPDGREAESWELFEGLPFFG